MLLLNRHPAYRAALDPADAEALGSDGADAIERFLAQRDNHKPTPLRSLPALATDLGVASVHIKDEGFRLGLGSFKALGGAYALIHLLLERASAQLARRLDFANMHDADVREIAQRMTFACATDGNHGRSVAQGAQLVGAKSVIFVHGGVSDERVAAIARFGAEMVRVPGTYDDSVVEAARVSERNGWTVVSDTSWDGYERIPALVMQGYTAIMREALRELPAPPTHVFVQAGVGGIAAALAGHLSLLFGEARPKFIVVDPARAACIFETAKAGQPVKIAHGPATVMAMLECYEPSPLAWRVLSRVADAFMTAEDDEAVAVMNRLARPKNSDPAVVAGESGGAGLAGAIHAAGDPQMRAQLGIDANARIFAVITEGATDPQRYRELVGLDAAAVAKS
jgi:diaminopropionate ammonia-lyase